jgi:hypothetical protein
MRLLPSGMYQGTTNVLSVKWVKHHGTEYHLDQIKIKVYLSRAPNTTGLVDLTVKCLLTYILKTLQLFFKDIVLPRSAYTTTEEWAQYSLYNEDNVS